MTANTFKIINPLAYHVNTVEKIDAQVRTAFVANDQKTLRELSLENRTNFDTFICVNSYWHAFLLLIPSKEQTSINYGLYSPDELNDVSKVEGLLFVWVCELRYDNMSQRTYLIDFRMAMFDTVEKTIKKSYFIGTFHVGLKGVQISALEAAPHHYNAIINDCVEFSKEMCLRLLAHSTNWLDIQDSVEKNIKEASATGLSIERLSRGNKLSG